MLLFCAVSEVRGIVAFLTSFKKMHEHFVEEFEHVVQPMVAEGSGWWPSSSCTYRSCTLLLRGPERLFVVPVPRVHFRTVRPCFLPLAACCKHPGCHEDATVSSSAWQRRSFDRLRGGAMQRLQGLWEALPQIPTPSYSLARRVGARTTLPDDALSDPSSGRWLHVEIP